MKFHLNLSHEEAAALRGLLNSFRNSLAICDQSFTWRNVGDPSTSYSLDDIILIEDLRADLSAQLDAADEQIHFAGCCHVY